MLAPETQALFDHVLSKMLCSLEDTNRNGIPLIDNVTGMKDMVVLVEVCEKYLRGQAEAKGQPTENIDSLRKTQTIKSDLAVSGLPASSVLLDNTHSSEEAEKRDRPGKRKWRRLLH